MITSRKLFSTSVIGDPKGQPRPRAFSRGGKASVYDPGTAEGWKASIALACRELEGAGIDSCLMVSLVFYMPRPKQHFRTSLQILPRFAGLLFRKKPDADNLAKAVLDCLTSIQAWKDDDQVTDLIVRKRYATDRPTGMDLEIHQLTEASDIAREWRAREDEEGNVESIHPESKPQDHE